jgi:hypothetical protein
LRDERKRNKVDGFVGIRLGPYFSLRSSKIRRRGKKKEIIIIIIKKKTRTNILIRGR